MKLPAASCGVSKRNCAEANPPSLLQLRRGSPRHLCRAKALATADHPCSKLQGILAKANKTELPCMKKRATDFSSHYVQTHPLLFL